MKFVGMLIIAHLEKFRHAIHEMDTIRKHCLKKHIRYLQHQTVFKELEVFKKKLI